MEIQNSKIIVGLDDLKAELCKIFPPNRVDEVFKHFALLKMAVKLGDYEKCLTNGGKFVEAAFKCLRHLRNPAEDAKDEVKVINEVNALASNSGTLGDAVSLTLPRVLYAIYELRTRRGGAHNFSFDANHMDCVFVVATANWAMEELARLYLINDPVVAKTLVENLMVKDISVIQELEGDFIVLPPKTSARVQVELLLYHHYGKRVTEKDLISWVKNQTAKNVQVSLRTLIQKNLVHKNQSGYTLTELGVPHAEEELALLSRTSATSVKTTSLVKKGTTRGKQRKPSTSARTRRSVSRTNS